MVISVQTSRASARCAGSGTETTERGVTRCPTCELFVRVQWGRIPSHGTVRTRGTDAHQERLAWAFDIQQRSEQ